MACQLKDSTTTLSKWGRVFLQRKVHEKTQRKIRKKAYLFPKLIDAQHVYKIKHFPEFEEIYTNPFHRITNPTLLLNALNEPFFTEPSYPYSKAEQSEYVYLETPKRGVFDLTLIMH